MQQKRRDETERRQRRAIFIALGVSVLLHLVLVLPLLLYMMRPPPVGPIKEKSRTYAVYRPQRKKARKTAHKKTPKQARMQPHRQPRVQPRQRPKTRPRVESRPRKSSKRPRPTPRKKNRPRPRKLKVRPRPRPRKKPLVEKKLRFRKKMVHQHTPKDEKEPKDADYLAEKNHDVKEQTRAKKTVLTVQRPARPRLARGKKRKVAHHRRSPDPRRSPRPAATRKKTQARARFRPRPRPRRTKQTARKQAAKAVKKRTAQHKPAPKKSDPKRAQKKRAARPRPATPLRMRARVRLQTDENAKKRAAARRASQPRRAQRAQSAQRRKQRRTYKLKIYPHKRQLQKLFAEKWQKEYEKNKDAQRRKKSGQASRHPAAKRWRKIKAAIENYVAEVKPGRATALRTRHHPFAKYIAAAHRNIHPLWGDGILNDWAEKPRKHPFNDRSRWAKVEMVINPDGTLHKAGLVKSSGYLPYDAAALDVVFTAAPYPRAPKKILSADKKVYLHWRFHRDHRQCGTFGVDAYILKNPTQKQTTDRAYARARNNRVRWDPARSFKRLHRRLGRNKGRLYRTATGKRSGYVAPARRSKRSGANAVEPEGDATDSTDSSRSGPQGKKRSRPSTEPRDRSSTRPRARPRTRSVKPATHGGNALFAQVAAAWLRAVGRGKRGVLEHLSALPFRSNSGVIARNPRQLRRALKSLLADGKETKPPRPAARFHLFTPAELRRYLKTLPSGLKTSPDERYAVGTLDGRRIILVLGHRDGAKRVVGLFR